MKEFEGDVDSLKVKLNESEKNESELKVQLVSRVQQ